LGTTHGYTGTSRHQVSSGGGDGGMMDRIELS